MQAIKPKQPLTLEQIACYLEYAKEEIESAVKEGWASPTENYAYDTATRPPDENSLEYRISVCEEQVEDCLYGYNGLCDSGRGLLGLSLEYSILFARNSVEMRNLELKILRRQMSFKILTATPYAQFREYDLSTKDQQELIEKDLKIVNDKAKRLLYGEMAKQLLQSQQSPTDHELVYMIAEHDAEGVRLRRLLKAREQPE